MKLMRELRCVSALPEGEGSGTNSWAGSARADCLSPLWTLRAVVEGPVDPATGYVCDVHSLDALLRDRVVPILRAGIGGPGAVAWALGAGFEAAAPHCVDGISLCSISLLVSQFTSYSVHRDDTAMVRLTRSYEFSAAHRLHSPGLSDDQNRRLFGKCSNPHGHGHNYVVEVTIGGTIDHRTGRVVDVGAFDRTVDELIITPFDHKNLNVECVEFAQLNPSVENIARVIFERLDGALEGPELIGVRVWETPKTYADCGRDGWRSRFFDRLRRVRIKAPSTSERVTESCTNQSPERQRAGPCAGGTHARERRCWRTPPMCRVPHSSRQMG